MHRFQKHYTREEARGLLPQLRLWLAELDRLRLKLETGEEALAGLMSTGQDLGGEPVNERIRLLAAMKDVLRRFEDREIILKDVQRGLVDFPALIGGREVFLCWERDEEDVEFWHDIDSGYAGRERL
jgi:hypothetical protein